MRIGKEQIMMIKKGQTKAFKVEDGAACHAAHTAVSYVKRVCMPANIENYHVSVDYKNLMVTIQAV
jgi:hypothetical protein